VFASSRKLIATRTTLTTCWTQKSALASARRKYATMVGISSSGTQHDASARPHADSRTRFATPRVRSTSRFARAAQATNGKLVLNKAAVTNRSAIPPSAPVNARSQIALQVGSSRNHATATSEPELKLQNFLSLKFV